VMLNSAVVLLIFFISNCIGAEIKIANILSPLSRTDMNPSMLMQKVAANLSGGACNSDHYYSKSCCTPYSPCHEGDGDCDSDADCYGNLRCHNDLNNCGYTGNGWLSDADCCAPAFRFTGATKYRYIGVGLCLPLGIRVYNGGNDNRGTVTQRTRRCAAACFNKKTPNEYGPWSQRGDAIGFGMTENDGRCYCQHRKLASCPIDPYPKTYRAYAFIQAPWACSIEIRVTVTSEGISSAHRYSHTYKRTASFKHTYNSVSASVEASASRAGLSGSFSGSLSMVNKDIQSNENEMKNNTGSTIVYKQGSHQIWRTETITMIINGQRLVDIRKTYVQSPSQDMGQAERHNLAKEYLKTYYGTDGSSPVIRTAFSVPAPY